MKILECIPNLSEGRNQETLDAISQAIVQVPEVYLLHRDVGKAAHRTVFTFAGPPEAVCEAAFQLYRLALKRIDMRSHLGTHPRMGAVDVCPLVPLREMDLAEATKYTEQLAQRLADELEIGGYFYESNAPEGQSGNLALLRKGGYEALPEKVKERPLQFGGQKNLGRFGATVIGARPILVAFNVNLKTDDVKIARRIAGKIRESGGLQKPGKLAGVKALGWYIADFNKVQVSCNLTRLEQNGMAETFAAIRVEAADQGVGISGSELIGLAPLDEFKKAGQKLLPGEKDAGKLVQAAIRYLGLEELGPFDPQVKIIEWNLEKQMQKAR